MRIGVIGGLGFIGSFVVEGLLDAGHEVTVISRSTRGLWRLRELYDERTFELRYGDITKPQTLRKAMKDLDAVINLVALISHPIKGFTYKVNFHGALNILRASYELGIKKVIHTSVAQVRFTQEEKVVAKLDYRAPKSEYLEGKVGGEIAAKYYEGKGLDVTVIRPTIVVGPRSSHGINTILLLTYIGVNVITFGNKETYINPIYVEDLAQAYVKSVEVENGTYYIAGKTAITLRNMLTYTAQRGMRIPPVFYLDNPKLAESILKTLNNLIKILGMKIKLPTERGLLDTLFIHNIYSYKKAEEDLGWKPKHTTKQGIEKTTQWFKENNLNNPLKAIKFIINEEI